MAVQQVSDRVTLVQSAGVHYSGNQADQTYFLVPELIQAGRTIVISDYGGSNRIALPAGLEITESVVASNEAMLTLSTGARINIRGADSFTYGLGESLTPFEPGVDASYEAFVQDTLGVQIPEKGVAKGGTAVVGDTTPVEPEPEVPTGSVVYESEPNGQLSLADSALIGDVLKGVTNENGDNDYFELQVQQGGALTLQFTHPNGPGDEGAEIVLAVLNEQGEVVTERTYRGDAQLNATLPAAGNYHVRVQDSTDYGSGGVNGNLESSRYSVATSLEHQPDTAYDGADNASIADAVTTLADGQSDIEFGDTLCGSVAHDRDRDDFKLVATQGGKVTLDFTHPNGPGNEGAEMWVVLRDDKGQIISERLFDGNATLEATVPGAGDYYVSVIDSASYGSSGVNGDIENALYQIRTQFETVADTAFDASDNDALSRAVDTLGDGATRLAFGHGVVGSVNGSGDTDIYCFSAEKGGAIVLDVTHPNGLGSEGAEMFVALLDIEGNLISQRDFRGDMQLNASVDKAGDYYLRIMDSTDYGDEDVNGNDVEDEHYQVTSRLDSRADHAYDTATNDTLSTAVSTLADGVNTIGFSHTLQGSVAESGDTDVFLLQAVSTTNVQAVLSHPNGPGQEGAEMRLEVLNAQGEQLAINSELNGDANALAFSVNRGEEYYVRVQDSTSYGSNDVNGNRIEDEHYHVDFLMG